MIADEIRAYFDMLSGGRRPSSGFTAAGPVMVAARRKGALQNRVWHDGGRLDAPLNEILAAHPAADCLEICATQFNISASAQSVDRYLRNQLRGRVGLDIQIRGERERYAPTEVIARNLSLDKIFDRILTTNGLDTSRFFELGGSLTIYDMAQFLVFPDKGEIVETFRANELVDDDQMGEFQIREFIRLASHWFVTNCQTSGEIPYKYWPSNGKYSTGDNTIRRFMATVALNRLRQFGGQDEVAGVARRNLGFNMKRFYRRKNNLGVIEWDGSVKLGAVALAALAIRESEQPTNHTEDYAALRRTIDALWNKDGSFNTFLIPEGRNDNQNFYPGEALLLLSYEALNDEPTAEMDRIRTSVAYYRDWHLNNRNPAFIPWHTMACANMFRKTQDAFYAEHVFEMNDWLLAHQQWDEDLDPDLLGRFFSPGKRYGPPHASATGVYLESLVEALDLANSAGDAHRAAAYRQAILRGARSICQLQFKNDVDLFYLANPSRALGAVRTEAYHNEIRVDNIQHPLMAMMRFLQIGAET